MELSGFLHKLAVKSVLSSKSQQLTCFLLNHHVHVHSAAHTLGLINWLTLLWQQLPQANISCSCRSDQQVEFCRKKL